VLPCPIVSSGRLQRSPNEALTCLDLNQKLLVPAEITLVDMGETEGRA
jgi:hypothetical protein